MNEALIRWLIFSVLLGLLPIAASLLRLLTRGDAPSVASLIAHGELLLPTASISAAAIGELLGSEGRRRTLGLISGGVATLVLMLSCFYYAEVTGAVPGVRPLDSTIVSGISFSFYLCAVVAGAACRIIAGYAPR